MKHEKLLLLNTKLEKYIIKYYLISKKIKGVREKIKSWEPKYIYLDLALKHYPRLKIQTNSEDEIICTKSTEKKLSALITRLGNWM